MGSRSVMAPKLRSNGRSNKPEVKRSKSLPALNSKSNAGKNGSSSSKQSSSRKRKRFTIFNKDSKKKQKKNEKQPDDKTEGKNSNSFKSLQVEENSNEDGAINPIQEDGYISLQFDEDDFSDDNADARSMRTVFEDYERQIEEAAEESDESDSASSKSAKKFNGSVGEFPWVVNHDHSHQREMADWLTLEIKDFVAYMSPSAKEIRARHECVARMRDVVKDVWPDAEAHVFGSFATDLYLPGSDIDMVIISSSGRYNTKGYLYQLSAKLRSTGIAKNIEVIAKARVPIIKCVDVKSSIHIDISFERTNGVQTVQVIRNWIKEYPALPYFVLVIKQFLARRKMNEVHTGGLGGFSVICMVMSFLKNHPRISSNDISVEDNLGVLLIEFFELYGKQFNYENVAVGTREKMPYIMKSSNEHLQGKSMFAIAIEDPNDPTNNLSKGSFNIRGIKKAFAGAFEMLTTRCYELEYTPFKDRIGKSILGNVIRVSGPEREFNEGRSFTGGESELNGISYPNVDAEDEIEPLVRFYSENSASSEDNNEEKGDQVNGLYLTISDDDDEEDEEAGIGDEEDDDSIVEIEPSRTTIPVSQKREYWQKKGGLST